jgi:hypothetical protein
MRIAGLFLLIVVALPGTAEARRTRAWTYEELNRESDVVVIAFPKVVRTSGEKIVWSGTRSDGVRESVKIEVEGLLTEFKVLTILRGGVSESTITLFHAAEPHEAVLNGPCLVSFDPTACRRYLLFLKRDRSGRYVTTTGQLDACLSVRDLGAHP